MCSGQHAYSALPSISDVSRHRRFVVMVRGVKQLPPHAFTPDEKSAYKKDLQCPMFTRLIKVGFPVGQLHYQSRMCPDIAGMVSALYYDGPYHVRSEGLVQRYVKHPEAFDLSRCLSHKGITIRPSTSIQPAQLSQAGDSKNVPSSNVATIKEDNTIPVVKKETSPSTDYVSSSQSEPEAIAADLRGARPQQREQLGRIDRAELPRLPDNEEPMHHYDFNCALRTLLNSWKHQMPEGMPAPTFKIDDILCDPHVIARVTVLHRCSSVSYIERQGRVLSRNA